MALSSILPSGSGDVIALFSIRGHALCKLGGSPPRVTAPAPSPSSKSDALIYVIWSLADIGLFSNGSLFQQPPLI
jgi:hypothetical protein